ncbi:MAG: hypothetical protein LBJ02_11755 [Bifidobacteriaceae bacterium]|jgi:hypothetical protein|nr:hypothetical protein [Bifidobacteriaceae bacterium]
MTRSEPPGAVPGGKPPAPSPAFGPKPHLKRGRGVGEDRPAAQTVSKGVGDTGDRHPDHRHSSRHHVGRAGGQGSRSGRRRRTGLAFAAPAVAFVGLDG